MARKATETIPLRPETKDLIKERKPDGETFDLWVRREALGIEREADAQV